MAMVAETSSAQPIMYASKTLQTPVRYLGGSETSYNISLMYQRSKILVVFL